MRFAGIDQGTTSTRLLVADTEGKTELAASRRHATAYPQPGRVEQDGSELLANIRLVLEASGEAAAVGLANQGESCLAWDALTGEPLSPVIVWQDARTAGTLGRMEQDGVAAEVGQRSGLPLDPYFSASKLAWIVENLAAAKEALRNGRLRLGTTDSFFLDRLTGRFCTDRATASRTGLMNIETGAWDPELCRLFGVPGECLAEIRPNTGTFGAVGSIPLTAAIVDQQAALYGHGCRHPGEAKITFGTGAFALAVTGKDVPRWAQPLGLLPTVAWDLGQGITYAVDGGVSDAGSAVEWALRAGLADGVEDLAAFTQPPAIGQGLVFVPAFSGLGCPWWDRSGSPILLGLGPEMTRRDMAQALLEGIALLSANVLDAMSSAGRTDRIGADGGLSRSPYFAQFLADCSGLTVVAHEFSERTAFGAAALAARAQGVELQLDPGGETLFHPNPAFPAEWRERFSQAVERCRGWR